jgi:peptidoglycan hydrolase-like protein with peptidoglycan-binding domain
MRVVISSGHGKYVRGASGYIDEVDEARKVVDRVAGVLRSMGADTTIYHDNVSTSQNENLNRIVDFHNSKTRDLDVSVHFNAYETTSKAMGSEVLYVSQATLARQVVDGICAAAPFINRGPKRRTDLFFLNNTEAPSILIETCFVDSKADVDIYRAQFGDICGAIAETILGEAAVEAPPPTGIDETMPTIGKGDEGDAVESLQTSLGVLVPDGDFGSITESWVKGFQAACDVESDGVVGPITWAEVDSLDSRFANGSTGLEGSEEEGVIEVAEASSLMQYSWRDRGVAPRGYVIGMALAYAQVLKCAEGTALWDAMKVMTKAPGDDEDDALAWLSAEFERAGISTKAGASALRATFVLLIGLGMRESSGKYYEGRDMSADNVDALTAEAGLFQTSWNISSSHDCLSGLLEEYWINPMGFLEEFKEGVAAPTASQLSCYGSGDGARYQFLARFAPSFAAIVTAVGCRCRRQHWGPINRKEVEILSEAMVLLKNVELVVQ